MDSQEKAIKIARLCIDKKAEDVKVLDIRKISTIADYFIICSGISTPRTQAIREAIEEKLRLEGARLWHEEGSRTGSWIILDYGDVIVHIFYESLRKFYDLDRLWGDADLIKIK